MLMILVKLAMLVEKPIALSLEDADRMVRVSEQTGRLMMVAQVLPFFPEFAYLKQVVDGGEYGNVLGAHFKRVISQPNWARSPLPGMRSIAAVGRCRVWCFPTLQRSPSV